MADAGSKFERVCAAYSAAETGISDAWEMFTSKHKTETRRGMAAALREQADIAVQKYGVGAGPVVTPSARNATFND